MRSVLSRLTSQPKALLSVCLLLAILCVAGPAIAAITITDQPAGSFNSTTNASSYTGGAWTPTLNDVLIVWVINSNAGTPDSPVVTDTTLTLTYTQVSQVFYSTSGTPTRVLTAFRASVTAAVLSQIVVTFGSNQTGCAVFVQSITGGQTTGTNAADAIVQAVTGFDDGGNTRSPCATPCTTASILKLAALTNRSNAVIAGFAIDGTVTPVVPSGWTLGTIQQYVSPTHTGNSIWNTAPDTIYPAVTWTGSSKNGAIALELAVATPPASSTTITHGPFVGAVQPTTASLWVRGDSAGEVTFKWGTDSGLAGATTQAVSIGPSTDFTGTLPISGLLAGTKYYYQAVGDVTSSAIHSFTTFPSAPTSAKFVFLTDFQDISTDPPHPTPTGTFISADAESPNLVLIGGDFDHSNPGVGNDEITSRSKTRSMWKRLYNPVAVGNADMSTFVANILRKYAIVHNWDDHDYFGNNMSGTYNWKDTVSKAEYLNYIPSYSNPPVAGGIWQTFNYGSLVQVFLLDSRSQRSPNSDPDNASKSMLDKYGVGPPNGQLDWLKTQLLASTATWKLVMSQVPWNHTSQKGTSPAFDNWYGFQTEQTALKTYLTANHIRNVILLVGDAHMGALENGTSDPLNLPEIIGPTPNFVTGGGETCNNFDVLGTWSNGTYGSPGGVCNGYTVLTFTTTQLIATIKAGNGTTSRSMTLPANSEPMYPLYRRLRRSPGGWH